MCAVHIVPVCLLMPRACVPVERGPATRVRLYTVPLTRKSCDELCGALDAGAVSGRESEIWIEPLSDYDIPAET